MQAMAVKDVLAVLSTSW